MLQDPSWEVFIQIGLVVGIFLGTLLLAWFYRTIFTRFIRRRTRIMNTNPTSYTFLKHAGTAIIYIAGFLMIILNIPPLRNLATIVLSGAGILAVAVGFASQAALSNIISGVFIVIFQPFRVNDRLSLQNDTLTGIVEDITLRHTVIRDFTNQRIIIPNTIISDEIIVNSDLNDSRVIKWVEFSLTLRADLERAKSVMVEEVLQHPLRIDGRTAEQIAKEAPEVPVRVVRIDESGIRLRAWAWAENGADGFALYCDLLESIKRRFDQEGIQISVPNRIVHLQQPS